MRFFCFTWGNADNVVVAVVCVTLSLVAFRAKSSFSMGSPCFLSLLWVQIDLTVVVPCTFHQLNLCHSHRGTLYPGF